MNAKTDRQWMVPHEWMVKPMHQLEWISRKGLLVWLAEVFSALGMGLYLVGLFSGSWWGALAGWLLIVLFKLPLHFVYLGQPWRFWRTLPPFTKAWKTSWFARGMLFSIVFVGFGFLQLLVSYLIDHDIWATSGADVVLWIVSVVAGLFCLLVGVYCGFAMSYCKAIPFWNTGLLPIIFVIMGVADGLALQMGIYLAQGSSVEVLEEISRYALIINALLIFSYVLNASYQSATAELSVKDLIKGHTAVVFWLGIVILGIIAPLSISIASLFTGEATTEVLIVAIACHTIGAFSLKYAVLKVGIYRPILPKLEVY